MTDSKEVIFFFMGEKHNLFISKTPGWSGKDWLQQTLVTFSNIQLFSTLRKL